jgi:GAF domain-containing protein
LIWRFDGQLLRFAVGHNVSAELGAFFAANPMAPGRGSTTGRAAVERRAIHVHDAQTDIEFTYGSKQVEPSLHTVLAIPMLRADELLGVITIYRLEMHPFTDSQIALVQTFADQAAIAIENARLLTELPGQERRPHRGARAADGDGRDPARDLELADRRAAGVRDHRRQRAPPV